jgi:hypothetical protein
MQEKSNRLSGGKKLQEEFSILTGSGRLMEF